MAYIYIVIGVLYGIRFLYKEIYLDPGPNGGIGMAILFAPFMLLFHAFVWPYSLYQELNKPAKQK